MLTTLVVLALASQQAVTVASVAELQRAVRAAKPGATILMESGTYAGGISLSNIHGASGRPITIAGASQTDPPRFVGGSSALHFSNVSHLVLRDLRIEGARDNGLNIDDGGSIIAPSHHLTLLRIRVKDLPKGNHDGIKLSGIEDFRVEKCSIERWGGSGVDMVGCHRGVLVDCDFRNGGDSGVQAKGGSSDVVIRTSRFENAGERGVNLGGSTGEAYFRPGLPAMGAEKFEAKDLTVEGCTFIRGGAPIAFVGVDGASVRFNTFYEPGRWVLRILQETTLPGFVPCRKGSYTDNLVVFTSTNWSAGGVNIGPGTQPDSFRFARNYWYCSDQPKRSMPSLPTKEQGGVYGVDLLVRLAEGDLTLDRASPAKKVGASAYRAPVTSSTRR